MKAKLISLDGGPSIRLENDVTLVGRKRGVCDINIDHTSVSKLHCLIVKTDGLLFLRDLGSTNGTKVNGQKVMRGALLPGDELAFANTKFRVFLGPDNADSEVEVGHGEKTEMMTSSPEPLDLEPKPAEFPPEEKSSESDVRMLRDDELED